MPISVIAKSLQKIRKAGAAEANDVTGRRPAYRPHPRGGLRRSELGPLT